MRIGWNALSAAPSLRLKSLVKSLHRNENGVSVIEFAFVAAPLLALIIAIFETSLTFLAQQALETTAEKAARTIVTGSTQQAGLTQSQFQTMVCGKLPSILQCSNLMIDVHTVNSFAVADTATPTINFNSSGNVTNTWQYNPGNPGDVVVLRLMYLWSTVKAPLGFDISTLSNGQRLLTSTAVFKSEPYSS